MTKTIFFLSITISLLLLSACGGEAAKQMDTAQIHSMVVLQSSTMEEWYTSESKAVQLREIAKDRNNPSASMKAANMMKAAKHFEALGSKIISRVEDLKKEMFKDVGENVKDVGPNSILGRSYSHIEPFRISLFSLYKVKSIGSTSILDLNEQTIRELVENIRSYREVLCSELVQSNSVTGQKPYFFKDPKIVQFQNYDDLNAKVDKAMSKSHIAPDDIEAVRKFYMDLSFTDEHWSQVFHKNMSWLTAFGVLISIENTVISARKNALTLMASRFNLGSEFPISALEPVVFGPEIAYEGEQVKMEVTIAGYNRDIQPQVQVHGGGQVVEIRDGKGIVQTKAPSGGKEMSITGTISIRTRSGNIISYPWRKTIVILKHDEDYYRIHGPKKN